MKPSLVVIGSSNTDMVIQSDHLPAPGETILGGSFFMNAGGKGANQAVAAARLGGVVTLVAKTGDDIFGRQAIQSFQQEGIRTDYIGIDDKQPSGVALITIDKKGENTIVVASGANAALSLEDVGAAEEAIRQADVVLTQLETPLPTVAFAAQFAKRYEKKFILNPAPACALPDELLQQISVLTPNETEAEILSGITVSNTSSVEAAAQVLRNKGVATVIITLGAKGAYISHEDWTDWIAAPVVQAVDTTAAGDVFNGALAVALGSGADLREAVRFACAAASISVTRLGAQAAAPYRHEVEVVPV